MKTADIIVKSLITLGVSRVKCEKKVQSSQQNTNM